MSSVVVCAAIAVTLGESFTLVMKTSISFSVKLLSASVSVALILNEPN